jgi:hypothetical protein
MNRRQILLALAASGAAACLPRLALGAAGPRQAIIGAAWRGPDKNDPYFAGALVADWEARTLEIRYSVPLPTRPHGLLAEADGGLLVTGVRPGTWLLRCDGKGEVTQQLRVDEEGSARLNGHIVTGAGGDVLYATETDLKTGRGRIGVRDRRTLRKLAEFDTRGIDPHQLLLDHEGYLMVANGGVPRTPADRKYDLQRMDSSLVRLDAGNGGLLRQWRLDDPRLSLRHLAWNTSARDGRARLGIALQAEHADATERRAAPILAVLDGDRLTLPTRANDGIGYAGDIAAAGDGGFVTSSNQAGLAQLWQPAVPDTLSTVAAIKEAYALAPWAGPTGGGVLIATALGLGRWHPTAAPALLPWPQPMALDNHWVLLGES